MSGPMENEEEKPMRSYKTLLVLAFLAAASMGVLFAQERPAPNMSFFITSAGPGNGGNLGGLKGADAHCSQLAAAVGSGNKTWRAYLSTAGEKGTGDVHARDRIGSGPCRTSKDCKLRQVWPTCIATTTS